MAGVLLLFAFSMSLFISMMEKKEKPGDDSDLSPGHSETGEK
jgi:hypothetical protein